MLRFMADKSKSLVLTRDSHKPKGLTLEQKKAVADWLQARWGPSRKCPMCETASWTIGSYLVQPETVFLVPKSADVTWEEMDVGYQFVPVFCRNCGQAVFLNAVAIGLLPRGKTDG
jgi:hypothetical protein